MSANENIHPELFYCKNSEPRLEWCFCMAFVGFAFFVYSFFYFIKICIFRRKYPGYQLKLFSSRILFLITLFIHGFSLTIQGFAYLKQWKVGKAKFFISHFSQYLVSCSLLYLLHSWLKIYLSCHSAHNIYLASRLKTTFIIFSLLVVASFIILLILRDFLSTGLCYKISFSIDIIRNAFMCITFFVIMYQLSKITGYCITCFLGHPGAYISTLCLSTGTLLSLGLVIRILIVYYQEGYSECSEFNLFLNIMLQCFCYLLPLGFISVIDTILPDPLSYRAEEDAQIDSATATLTAASIVYG